MNISKVIDDITIIFGNDVVALFPSMMAANTGKIVREIIEESDMKIEGVDYREISRYVVINRNLTGNLKELWNVLPWRRKSGGITPCMKNKEVNGKKSGTEISWVFPKREPTDKQKRQLLARMGEIGLRAVFETFAIVLEVTITNK